MDEFDLIKTFFHQDKNLSFTQEQHVALGNGDDAAVFDIPQGQQLVSAIDTLIQGVHFPNDAKAADIAYKALAVNLSDLAAMGARPHSFLLSLTLPEVDKAWLNDFSKGLFALANAHQMVLLGGDTSKGPLSVSIQVNGRVPKHSYLKRSTLQAGDLICTTGYLGLAAFGLQHWQNPTFQHTSEIYERAAIQRFTQPEARVAFAEQLYECGVRACIDISDGLLQDLGHMCRASGLAAELECDQLLVHKELQDLPKSQQLQLMLSGGDDYELCFGMTPEQFDAVKKVATRLQIPLTNIGRCVEGHARFDQPITLLGMPNDLERVDVLGYKHFV